jgi:hypothetical protein
MKSPLSLVKDKFGDKEKLVAEVQKFVGDELWVSRENKAKGLAHVSNAKLLRLHATFAEVKEKFGTRAKLIDSILDLEKRTKDEGYKSRLLAYPVPRLYDLFKSVTKRNARAAGTGPSKKEVKTATAKAAAAAPKKAVVAPKKASPKGGAKKKSSKR